MFGAGGAAVRGATSVGSIEVAVSAAEQAVSSRSPNVSKRILHSCCAAELPVAVAMAREWISAVFGGLLERHQIGEQRLKISLNELPFEIRWHQIGKSVRDLRLG